jgi:hypothetical protein
MASRKSSKSNDVLFAAATRSRSDWTFARLRAAEIQADGGNYTLATQVCDWLLTDDRISGTLGARTEALLGLTPTFEPSGDKRRSNRAVKALDAGDDWFIAYPEAELDQLHSWGLLLGVAPGRHNWAEGKRNGGRLLPFPAFWYPETLQQDQRTREWSICDSTNKRHILTPGDSEWLLHTPFGQNRPHARGLWRSLKNWALLKRLAMMDLKRLGAKGATAVGTSPDGSTFEQRQELAKAIAESEDDAVIILAAGFDLKLIQSYAGSQQIYDAQIKLADLAIAIRIRGGNLSTNVEEGSRAAAKEQKKSGDNAKLLFDDKTLSSFVHDQSLVWWAEFNYGDPELAPWPAWPVEQGEDLQAKVETEEKSFQTVDLAEKLGFDVDRKAFLEAHKIDWAKEGKRPDSSLPVPGAPPQPGAPPAPGQPPAPPAPPVDSKELPAPKPGKKAAALNKLLAFSRAAKEAGQEGAQKYADDLATAGLGAIAGAIDSTISAIEAELDAATGYDDLLERLRKRYVDLDPSDIIDVVESVMVLAELGGMHAVNLDN